MPWFDHRVCGKQAKEKQLLRAKARAEDRTSDPERSARNQAIIERLESFSVFAEAQTVLVYVSMPWEVDTHDFIERTIARGRNVLAPRVAPEHALQWSNVESLNDLVVGKHGVLEPSPEAKILEVPDDAIALIPGLEFDRVGYRLGHGEGYYDRFLVNFKGLSIGLTFDCRLKEALPHEDHDETVNYIVTESEIVNAV